VIVDEHQRVGDVWRKRWDSLRLFTLGRYNGLPGMPFPGPPSAFPTKDDIAEYFETYAREFGLLLPAENVVLATGAFHHPRVPAFAAGLAASIVQLHSSEYRNRSQLRQASGVAWRRWFARYPMKRRARHTGKHLGVQR
jgi:putative flavoprotein involved in K+ transport